MGDQMDRRDNDMNRIDESDDMDDLLILNDDDEHEQSSEGHTTPAATWKVLIVDDEMAVHQTTRLVLKDIQFEGKRLELISAYTSAEAKEVLANTQDIAIILLDVVMESHDAGLQLIRHIRETIGNRFVRIILRTGQPGQAPEERIVLEYDINDYKTKTELTVQKLFTTIIASIRAYKDLVTIDKNRKGLADILSATNKLFEMNSLKKFVAGLITQFTAMYGFEDNTIFARTSGLAASDTSGELMVLAATGEFISLRDKCIEEIPDHAELLDLIKDAKLKKASILNDRYFVGYYHSHGKIDNYFIVKGLRDIDQTDREMIQLFSEHISVAFDSFTYHERVVRSQREMIFKLSEVLEHTANDRDKHINKFSSMVYQLSILADVPEQDAYLLSVAASIHDLGNIDVPKDILDKPGKLSELEYGEVKAHTQYGRRLLEECADEIVSIASIIAFSHHENWDGSGYPLSLLNEQIHVYSRIVAIVDVYVTLQRKTTYREAWTRNQAIQYIREQIGVKFDPRIATIFLDNIELIENGCELCSENEKG